MEAVESCTCCTERETSCLEGNRQCLQDNEKVGCDEKEEVGRSCNMEEDGCTADYLALILEDGGGNSCPAGKDWKVEAHTPMVAPFYFHLTFSSMHKDHHD